MSKGSGWGGRGHTSLSPPSSHTPRPRGRLGLGHGSRCLCYIVLRTYLLLCVCPSSLSDCCPRPRPEGVPLGSVFFEACACVLVHSSNKPTCIRSVKKSSA
ncbi:unnamed protein product, partial [Discosporangium mesarthrocarpum]